MSVLEIDNVSVTYTKGKQQFRAVNGVSLQVKPGETVALVGESGCGKTTLARAILGLQPFQGEIRVGGEAVHGVRPMQARSVGVVWQDPFASLDPRWKVGDLILEPVRLVGQTLHLDQHMERCGLKGSFADRYPHQLSGGQRQRVAIARALALEPGLVLCDEPTSALDLSVQAQILNLLKDLQQETGCAYLYISHDLATVRYLSDRVAVMYRGRIVEEGPTESVFTDPAHPYTRLLLDSALTHESVGELPKAEDVEAQAGPEVGCPFAPRCSKRQPQCTVKAPELTGFEHRAACFFPLREPH